LFFGEGKSQTRNVSGVWLLSLFLKGKGKRFSQIKKQQSLGSDCKTKAGDFPLFVCGEPEEKPQNALLLFPLETKSVRRFMTDIIKTF
jgi:hypothetical protein